MTLGLITFTVVAGWTAFRQSGNRQALLVTAAFLSFSLTPATLVVQAARSLAGLPFKISWWPLADAGAVLFLCILLHINLTFPRSRGIIHRYPKVLALCYLPAATLGPALISGMFLSDQKFESLWGFTESHIMMTAVTVGFITALIAVGYLAMTLRTLKSPQYRESTKWLLLGLSTATIVWLFSDILFELLGQPVPPLVEGVFGNVPALTVAFTYTQAIYRHGFLSVDNVITRTITYGLVTLVLGGVYFLAAGVLGWMSGSTLGETRPALAAAAVTALAAILMKPLHARAQAAVERKFHPERVRAKQALAQLIDEMLSSGWGWDNPFGELAKRLVEILHLDVLVVYFLDPSGQFFLLTESAGNFSRDNHPHALPAGGALEKFLADSPGPVSASVCLRKLPGEEKRLMGNSRLGWLIPLSFQGALRGFLAMGPPRGSGFPNGKDLLLIDRLSRQAMILVETSKFQRLATVDELTGVMTRFVFEKTLARELARANRHGSHFCVLMLDLDDFKQVNDLYGHQVGDQVLAAVGAALKNNLRESDLVARYGGEEFILLLPETGQEEGIATGERLRRSVSAIRVPLEKGGTVSVTASFGLFSYPPDGERGTLDYTEIIRRTDLALYRAKADGRNRLSFY